jgi:hypothetical protein
LLHTALLDLPPQPSSSSTEPPLPTALPSYCDTQTYRPPRPQANTISGVQLDPIFPPPPPRTAYLPPPRPPHTDEQEARDLHFPEGNAFEDAATYQRARIMERAALLDTSPPRLAKGQDGGPLRRRRRSSGLDTTAEERRLFEEGYARFVSRLSTLSRQARQEEEAEPLSKAMGKKAAERKMETLKMATCLSDSVRECFTDPVVIELIQEVTMLRFRKRQEQEQEDRQRMAQELRPE